LFHLFILGELEIAYNIGLKGSWIFESGAIATSKNSIWEISAGNFLLIAVMSG